MNIEIDIISLHFDRIKKYTVYRDVTVRMNSNFHDIGSVWVRFVMIEDIIFFVQF